ncbi:MAG: hypothetical protein K0U68_15500 [Gammaproteobacteria bacterium]|nr:hypothetical protein [Gammaproteobacteria bacterium]
MRTPTTLLNRRVTFNPSFNFSYSAFYIFSAISTLIVLGWLLYRCRYGIDFTDESSYLVWISQPFNYNASISQFGFVYHLLFDLLKKDIVSLRQANIIITFALTWLFVDLLLTDLFESPKEIAGTLKRLIVAALFATTSLIYLYSIPTPSYNTLTFQAFLITASGLLLAKKNSLTFSKTGYILIGLGGWLAFMAKPSSAAALALIALIYLITIVRKNIHLLVVSLIVTSSMLIFSALIIDGSIILFLRRLQEGYSAAVMLQASHSPSGILRWDDYIFTPTAKYFSFYSVLTLSIIIFVSQYRSTQFHHFRKLLFIFFFWALIALTVSIIFDCVPEFIATWLFDELLVWKFQLMMIWVIPFSALLAGFLLSWDKLELQIKQIFQAVCFFLLPHAYAFGTNGNYWAAGSITAIFWIAGGFSLLSIFQIKHVNEFLILLGLSSQLANVVLVNDGQLTPYRQPGDLTKNNVAINFGHSGSLLILSENYARYLSTATLAAKTSGFENGIPMIDLTGQSPGILYAIGAFSIGRAWTIGGYPGSDNLARYMLKKNTCNDLATAWIIDEPDGPRKISNTILNEFGADLNVDYLKVAEFKTAEYAGGYKKPRLQQMFKPIRSIDTAIAACEIARQSVKKIGPSNPDDMPWKAF